MNWIADHHAELRELGWQVFFDQQVSELESQNSLVARVFAHHGNQVLFRTISNEFSVPTAIVQPVAQSGGDQDGSIAVGDWFLLEKSDHRGLRKLERKTLLCRRAAGDVARSQVIASNIDTVFIVSSCNQDFNLSRLERYLALILESGAMPVVVLTKADLCEDPMELRQLAEALRPGLIVETLDARENSQTAVLDDWCTTGKTVALLGSSGVGKSTLANTLGGLDLLTSEIRADDDKGRHTTTARSMHKLKAGGWLIDNPGMRELQLPACEQGVADLFDDLMQLAQRCRFRNCSHNGDVGCALIEAVVNGELEKRRLANYLKLLAEQARNSASLAEWREKDRKQGQLYKSVIAEKRDRQRGF